VINYIISLRERVEDDKILPRLAWDLSCDSTAAMWICGKNRRRRHRLNIIYNFRKRSVKTVHGIYRDDRQF